MYHYVAKTGDAMSGMLTIAVDGTVAMPFALGDTSTGKWMYQGWRVGTGNANLYAFYSPSFSKGVLMYMSDVDGAVLFNGPGRFEGPVLINGPTSSLNVGQDIALGQNAADGAARLYFLNANQQLTWAGNTFRFYGGSGVEIPGGDLTVSGMLNSGGGLISASAASYGPQVQVRNMAPDASSAYMIMSKQRGTADAVQVGDTLGSMLWQSWNGSAFVNSAMIAPAITSVSGATVSARLGFDVADTAGNLWNKMTIYHDHISIPISTQSTQLGDGALVVTGGIGVGGNVSLNNAREAGSLCVGSLGHKIGRDTTNGSMFIGGGQYRVEIDAVNPLWVKCATNAGNTVTGGLIVNGGAGIGADLYASQLLSNGMIKVGHTQANGVIYFGNSYNHYLQYDGGQGFSFGGTGSHTLTVATVVASDVVQAGNFTTTGCVIHTGFGGTGQPWQVNCVQANPNWGVLSQMALHYSGNWAGWHWDVNGPGFDFRGDGNAYKSGGSASWVITSDARIKAVTGDYTSGLDAIAALQPVRYKFLGNDSYGPPSNTRAGQEPDKDKMDDPVSAPYPNSNNYRDAVDQVEHIGLIAQAAEVTMPEMVSQTSGYIDGIEVQDLRHLDTTPLIFAMINAIKELKVKVETLEAAAAGTTRKK